MPRSPDRQPGGAGIGFACSARATATRFDAAVRPVFSDQSCLWSVSRYDAGTKFDFYYRWVRGYYLQTAPCS